MPDPIGGIIGGLGDAASSVAAQAFDSAMQAIWKFATALLSGVLALIDQYTKPNVDPINGPLGGLFAQTLWLGTTVAVFMAFVQVGRSVMQGGRGFSRLFIGLFQYAVITVAGLGILATAVAAADSLARGILHTGLGIDSWSGLNDKNSVLQNTVNGVSGVGLGLIALLCVIPAALGYLLEALVRDMGVLVLAGTIPILAGGLLSDSTRRWFWTGLRWAIALLLFTPTTAFTVTMGLKIAAGAAGASGQQPGAGQSAVGAVVAGLILVVSLGCPLAMFKLFAWVDPNTLSGASVRDYFTGARGAFGGGGAGRGVSGSSEPAAEADTDSRFGQAMGGLGSVDPAGMGAMAHNTAADASGVLDAMGAGHPGGPSGMQGAGGEESGGQEPEGEQAGQVGGGSESTPGGDVVPGAPSGAPGSVTGAGGPAAGDGGAGSDVPAAVAAGDPVSAVAAAAPDVDAGSGGNAAPPPPAPMSPGPDAAGGGAGGAGGVAAGGEAAEAAVIAL